MMTKERFLLGRFRRAVGDFLSLEGVLVRAFVEERGLVVRRNRLLSEFLANVPSVNPLLKGISFDLATLIRLLGSRLTENDRKKKGAVYTPESIVNAICRRVLEHARRIPGASSPDVGRVLDPAVGVGAFLVGMAEHLRKITGKPPSEIVERQLFGVDVNPEAVRIARLLLNLWVLDAGEDVTELQTNLLVDDALSEVPLYRRFGLEEGFDLVVGNPPYVRVQNLRPEERERLRALWYSAGKGNIDLYLPFVELGMREIHSRGVVGYIVPTTFFSTEAGRRLREILWRERSLLELVDFHFHQVFENATTYPCLLFLSKQRTSRFRYVQVASAGTAFEEKAEIISLVRRNPSRWAFCSDEVHVTIQAIESAGRPLGQIARIGVGIATLADRCYLLDGETEENLYVKMHDGIRYLIEPELTRPILKVSRLKTEEDIRRNRERILFPYRLVDGKHRIVPETVLRTEYPNAYAYLCAVRERLDQRDRGKPNPVAWYAFGRSQGLNANFGRKLLTSGLNVWSNFLLCEDEGTIFYAGYCVQPREESESLRVLQRILNSPVLDFYIHHTSRIYRDGYRSFAKAYLERFGIPTLSPDEKDFILSQDNPDELWTFLIAHYRIGGCRFFRAFLEEYPKRRWSCIAFSEKND